MDDDEPTLPEIDGSAVDPVLMFKGRDGIGVIESMVHQNAPPNRTVRRKAKRASRRRRSK